MTKNVNYEQEVVLLIESKDSLRVAKPNLLERDPLLFIQLIVGGTPRKTIALTIRSLDRWVSPSALPNLQDLSAQLISIQPTCWERTMMRMGQTRRGPS